MSNSLLTSQIGQRISLPGHFDVPVILEDARPLGPDDSAGYECRVRLPDGSLEEAVISAEEFLAVIGKGPDEAKAETPVDAEKLRLLIESTRIRLAYAHDQQFAVSLSGIRAHKIADVATGDVFVKRVEVKGRLRGQPVRLTTNEWYKAAQLAETYWLYVVWDPLSDSPEIVRIHNPIAKLDHAKSEIVAARFYEIPTEAVMTVASQGMG
ncbi:MAG TPA: DUF3883 domain-containing protein [Syntrophorhabdaceae bacterium]|nr:DUF3883 domain-containing protein [Syntrophorhabdaceae bacterium]